MNNPLINLNSLPPFSNITPAHIEPAIDQILAESRSAIEKLLDSTDDYTWGNLMQPLDDLEDRLERAWSPVGHMNSVVNSDELREAYMPACPSYPNFQRNWDKMKNCIRRSNILLKVMNSVHWILHNRKPLRMNCVIFV